MGKRMVRIGALAFLMFTLGAEADSHLVKIEDWSGIAVGTKGIPPGWKSGQSWGRPNYDFIV